MLAHRIQATDSLTWRDVCKSLRHVTVGRSDVADEIEGYVSGSLVQVAEPLQAKKSFILMALII